jgi:hypothetical protein
MIDFESLVESILMLEADPTSTEETIAKSVEQFLANQTTAIQDLWKTKYKDFYQPQSQDITGIAYLAAKNVTRDTAKAAAYPYIESLFPLLDIAGELKEEVYSKAKATAEQQKQAQTLFSKWVGRIKSDKSPTPITFTPSGKTAPWVQSVRAAYYKSKNEGVGEARLERLDQSFSIYTTIATLMEIRKKDMAKKLPANFMQTNTAGFVDTVITKYAKIEGGSIPMRDEKINKIYDDATAAKLLNAAQAAYNYFKFEVQERAGIQDPSQQNAVMNNQSLYELFLGKGKKQGPEINWAKILKLPSQAESKTYNLGTILAASKGNDESAKALINALTALADYIRQQKEFDLVGALNKTADVASALTLGVA